MTDNLKLIIINAAGLILDITLIIILLIIKHKENKKNMKYIRTKDKIEKVPNDYASKLVECPNLKIADTIEELCDEFIGILNGRHIKSLSKDLYILKPCEVIYGAIWTDKGLIYVAKMNEKGELELL